MKEAEKKSFAAQVRRKLIGRLLLAAMGLSILFGGMAWVIESRSLERQIVELTVEQASLYDSAGRLGIERWQEADPGALARAFESFVAASAGRGKGGVTLARLYARDRELLTSIPAQPDATSNALMAEIERSRGDTGVDGPVWHRYVTVDGQPYVILGGPMHDLSGQVMAHAEGAVRIPAAELVRLRRSVARTMALVVLITLLTTASIYPIVMRLTRRMIVLSGNLLTANVDTAQVLGAAIAKRDSDTSEHNFRVTIISVRIAEAYGLDGEAIRSLIKGSFVHDVGKIAIRDEILLKPGKLTDEEYEIMKTHVQAGCDIVENSRWLREGSNVVRYHHEKFDGSGYLHGLSGDEIPITARIFAVADVFDACASRRPYKEPMSFGQTMAILAQGRGTHFDPGVLDVFEPMAPILHRELIADPQRAPEEILTEIARHYYSQAVDQLSL